ncbi:unnamed protein product [Closterium sp. Naga37s-1]|nr:unnamed protein product [Closterium sp. Naga37s-1]
MCNELNHEHTYRNKPLAGAAEQRWCQQRQGKAKERRKEVRLEERCQEVRRIEAVQTETKGDQPMGEIGPTNTACPLIRRIETRGLTGPSLPFIIFVPPDASSPLFFLPCPPILPSPSSPSLLSPLPTHCSPLLSSVPLPPFVPFPPLSSLLFLLISPFPEPFLFLSHIPSPSCPSQEAGLGATVASGSLPPSLHHQSSSPPLPPSLLSPVTVQTFPPSPSLLPSVSVPPSPTIHPLPYPCPFKASPDS